MTHEADSFISHGLVKANAQDTLYWCTVDMLALVDLLVRNNKSRWRDAG